jgi:hypothetical protein
MTGARGCNILVDVSGIYGIHNNEKLKKENEKDKSIIQG